MQQFLGMYFVICSCLKGWAAIDAIWKEKNKHESALGLAKLLAKQDFSWKYSYKAEEDSSISLGLGKGGEKGTQNSKEGSKATTSEKSETLLEIPLLLAAREGIEEIFNEILNEYRQAVDHVSNNGHNILHLAILHRQDKIFERLKQMEMSVQKLASKIDNNGNTILHQVAERKHYEGGKRPANPISFFAKPTHHREPPHSTRSVPHRRFTVNHPTAPDLSHIRFTAKPTHHREPPHSTRFVPRRRFTMNPPTTVNHPMAPDLSHVVDSP
ncbi:hypothetical protein Pint_09743 [Pistacia integerrima]|uniref:Uncharacterized protein n=1 Tax=Pistacia integerrima TaxID=434235 RepID=A0ACC0XHR8_9ROSI|nr:hypothetical protein Pint_09743 [Pistacia integerrima]